MAQFLPHTERRRAPRVPLTVRVQLFYKGVEIQVYSTDISITGMFVETPQPLPVGSKLLLGFTIGSVERKTIQAEGRVVQVRTPEDAATYGVLPGMGIMFQGFLFGRGDLAAEISERLDGLLDAAALPPDEEPLDPRALVGFPVLWGPKPPPSNEGFIIELQGDQAYLVSRNPESPGTHLYLSFELPTSGVPQRVRAIAQVVRSNRRNRRGEEPCGMGIWLDPTGLDDPTVLDFMASHLRRRRESLMPETLAPPPPEDDLDEIPEYSDLGDPDLIFDDGGEVQPGPEPQEPEFIATPATPSIPTVPSAPTTPTFVSQPMEPEFVQAPVVAASVDAVTPLPGINWNEVSWSIDPREPSVGNADPATTDFQAPADSWQPSFDTTESAFGTGSDGLLPQPMPAAIAIADSVDLPQPYSSGTPRRPDHAPQAPSVSRTKRFAVVVAAAVALAILGILLVGHALIG
jgi:hypothetical protein